MGPPAAAPAPATPASVGSPSQPIQLSDLQSWPELAALKGDGGGQSPGEPGGKGPPPRDEPEDDPAMKPQSVLNRVKMFENKRSVSVDRAKDGGDPSAPRVRTPQPDVS